ncbi:hypothetical protein BDK51DRAFT_26247, partial [Blyttiomyces helicus]
KKGNQAFDALIKDLSRKSVGPVSSGTVAQTDAVLDRLTDTQAYTGTHKLRFDDEGHGLGMAGRDQPSKTNDLAKIANREATSLRGLPVSADPAAGASSASRNATPGKRSHASVVTASSEKLDLTASKPKKADARRSNTNLAAKAATTPARRPNPSLAGPAASSSSTTRRSNQDLSSTPASTRASRADRAPAAASTTRRSNTDLASGARRTVATPASKGTYNASGTNSSVFDRLTTTAGYTGTHKLRFNADGTGRGMAGRDAPAKGAAPGAYRGGDVKDLSQILRS